MAQIEYYFYTANPNYRPWLRGCRPWQSVDQNNRSERAFKFVTETTAGPNAFPEGSILKIAGKRYVVGKQITLAGLRRRVLLHLQAGYPDTPTPDSYLVGMDPSVAEDCIAAYSITDPSVFLGARGGTITGRWAWWKAPNQHIIEKDKGAEPSTRQLEANAHYIRWNTLEIQRRAIENNIPIVKEQQIHYLCDVMNIFR